MIKLKNTLFRTLPRLMVCLVAIEIYSIGCSHLTRDSRGLMTCLGAMAIAEEPSTEITEFIQDNCIACHDAGTTEGDLNLESLTMDLSVPDNFYLWERVYDRVRTGEMPPEEKLDAADKKVFGLALGKTLLAADAKASLNRGRVSARRLTRAQYERNVCDLLQIDVPLREYLPAESLDDGFDTVSSSQQISDHSMLAYLKAADVALDAAFNRVKQVVVPRTIRLDWTKLRRDESDTDREPQGRPEQKDVVAWSTDVAFYGRMRNTKVSQAGRYRIRLRAQAVNPPNNGVVWCGLESGYGNNRESALYWIGGFEATEKPTEHEFTAWIKSGHKLLVVPKDSGLVKASFVNRRINGIIPGRKPAKEIKNLPGVAIKWIEMERLDNVASPHTQQALIGELALSEKSEAAKSKRGRGKSSWEPREIISKTPESDLRELTLQFAQRAFRKPVTADEINPYADFAIQRYRESKSFEAGLRAGYRAILCSPRFLFFEETPGKLGNYALANRLSHFLWGMGPDPQLLKLAADGTIGNESVLQEQVERMLKDPQSAVFFKEFTEQWLKLYGISDTNPDGKLYPEYDDVLHHTLPEETHAFVAELIKQDLPITNVVDSNFTYLNSRLARHYGIEWPGGTGMKRVELKKSDQRGGIITHASILKVTANGTTTSPILRGVWMLERIVGLHVPPPPSNVPAVEPDIRGATSIRSQLAKHRSSESCASCHVKIDPPGFALESYDVIGGFRTRYRTLVSKKGKTSRAQGNRVDSSYTFPSGKRFNDIHGLKKMMLKDPEQLAKSFASHLITYATGAQPSFSDRKGVTAIAQATEDKKYGVRSIIKQVILSPQFRYK